MLCWFLLYSKVTRLSIDIYSSTCSFPLWFITGYWMIYHRTLIYSRTLLFIPSIYCSLHLLIPSSQSFPLSPPCPLRNHKSVLYVSLLFFFFTFTIFYWFCHISTWIHHRYTRVSHPEPSSLLPPRTIPLGCPSAPAPSILYPASNLDWRFVSYTILYMFQCHSPKSSHPLPLPQSPKDCSIHQCLFCCLVYKVIVTIFLNSIYMR